MTDRTLVVSDIHGCYQELRALLKKCDFKPDKDIFVSLGDVLDRGPQPSEVVNYVRYNGSALLGNHDERQIRYYREWQRIGMPKDKEVINKRLKFKAHYHAETFHALTPDQFEWLAKLPTFMRLDPKDCDGKRVSLVHAGCLPDVPLEEQDPNIHLRICNIVPAELSAREYDSEGRLLHGYWPVTTKSWWTSKAPPTAKFWATLYSAKSEGTILFGHSGFEKPAWFKSEDGTVNAVGLDTGACFGRTLTAMILPDWRTVSVQSSFGVESGKTKLYEIAPGIKVYSG